MKKREFYTVVVFENSIELFHFSHILNTSQLQEHTTFNTLKELQQKLNRNIPIHLLFATLEMEYIEVLLSSHVKDIKTQRLFLDAKLEESGRDSKKFNYNFSFKQLNEESYRFYLYGFSKEEFENQCLPFNSIENIRSVSTLASPLFSMTHSLGNAKHPHVAFYILDDRITALVHDGTHMLFSRLTTLSTHDTKQLSLEIDRTLTYVSNKFRKKTYTISLHGTEKALEQLKGQGIQSEEGEATFFPLASQNVLFGYAHDVKETVNFLPQKHKSQLLLRVIQKSINIVLILLLIVGLGVLFVNIKSYNEEELVFERISTKYQDSLNTLSLHDDVLIEQLLQSKRLHRNDTIGIFVEFMQPLRPLMKEAELNYLKWNVSNKFEAHFFKQTTSLQALLTFETFVYQTIEPLKKEHPTWELIMNKDINQLSMTIVIRSEGKRAFKRRKNSIGTNQ